MPSTPSDNAHEAHLRATSGDGNAEAMRRAGAEARAARAVGGAAAPETAGLALSPVRVVPSGLWRPKAIAAALRAADIAALKEARDITASMLGFRDWRELERAATKGRADPPDEQCSAEEVRRRRAYQAYALASSSSMGPRAAAIAVDALQPTAKAGRPALDAGTLARMWEVPREHAKAPLTEYLAGGANEDDWDDRGEPEADCTGHEDADAVARVLAEAGLGSLADPMDVVDVLQRTPSIPVSVWSPVLEKRFGWAITPTDEDLERNGG